jgi:hypothetical protein
MTIDYINSPIGIFLITVILSITYILNWFVYILLNIIGMKSLYILAMACILCYSVYGGYLAITNEVGLDGYLLFSVVNIYYGYRYSLLL